MGSKDQRRLLAEAQFGKQFVRPRPDFDPALFRESRIVLPDVIEMGEFGAQTPEIVPDTLQDRLDLVRRFFGESCHQIGATDPMFTGEWAEQARDVAEKVGGL